MGVITGNPVLSATPEVDDTGGMKPSPDPHFRHRFPTELISHAVWLYHVFSLSLRDVELLLAERGIIVSHETVRRWCQKCGESSLTPSASGGLVRGRGRGHQAPGANLREKPEWNGG